MNLTSPEDKISNSDADLEIILSKFEIKLNKEDNDEEYYHLVIGGELNSINKYMVEQAYLSAGWSKAICKTSSENGERPGLTGLQLWR